MSISLIRIDDRLIHGQVVTAWSKHVNANIIAIVDDEVANDEFLQSVLKMVAPSDIKLHILTVEASNKKFTEWEESSQNIVILVKTPIVAKTLFDNGIKFKELNVGGIGASRNRKLLYKNISVSNEEIEVLKQISDMGISIYCQATPDNKKVYLKTLI